MVEEQQLTALLKRRFEQLRDWPDEHERLELIALGLSSAATEEQHRRAGQLIEEDPSLAEAVRVLDSANVVPLQARRHRALPFLALAAAILLVALFLGPLRSYFSSPPGELTPMGAYDHVAIGVQRDGMPFVLSPGQRLLPGDRLGFFYTTSTPGNLMLLHLDEAKKVTLLYPAGGLKSATILPGSEVSLPDGAVAEAGTGCEWFVAVFSDSVLDLSAVEAALNTATLIPEKACRMNVQVPSARSVRVLSVKR